jgi:hypothetical protein
MICPVCQLELGIERRAGELVLTYSFMDWAAGCRCRQSGDPVLCGNLLPTILKELAESKVAALRSKSTREG